MVYALFMQFDGHLAWQGCIPRNVQKPDASIIPVPRNHNTREENKAIKNKEMPEGWAEKPAKPSQKDTDARWTKKHGNSLWLQKSCERGPQAQAGPRLPRKRHGPA